MANTLSFTNTVRRQGLHLSLYLSLVVTGLSCIPAASILTETLTGKDSAGATIEIEKPGAELVRARVLDVVLGTGETLGSASSDGQIAFTIAFPAGVQISYEGIMSDTRDSGSPIITGTWVQHSAGLFGEDRGTWSVATVPE